MKKRCTGIAATLLALITPAAMAQGYLAGTIGSTDYNASGFENGTSVSLLIGYEVSEAIALEASYINLGEVSDNIAPVWTLEGDGIILAVRGNLPVTPQLDLFGRVGMFMWDLTLDQAGSGQIAADEGTDLMVGIGLSLQLSREFDLVAEYRSLEIDGEDVDNLALGFQYNF